MERRGSGSCKLVEGEEELSKISEYIASLLRARTLATSKQDGMFVLLGVMLLRKLGGNFLNTLSLLEPISLIFSLVFSQNSIRSSSFSMRESRQRAYRGFVACSPTHPSSPLDATKNFSFTSRSPNPPDTVHIPSRERIPRQPEVGSVG